MILIWKIWTPFLNVISKRREQGVGIPDVLPPHMMATADGSYLDSV